MIIDLANIGDLDDKQRKHLELSIYVGYALERAQKFEQAVALLIALSRAEDRLDDNEAFRGPGAPDVETHGRSASEDALSRT